MRDQPSYNRRSMLIATTSTFALFTMGVGQSAFAESMSPKMKSAVDAYIYFYPLVVFGVSFEVLTNVEKPTWERLSAPVNQFMSVKQNRPDNHGVILPSTDTLYTMAWVDVAKEPVVFYAPEIPNIPGGDRKRPRRGQRNQLASVIRQHSNANASHASLLAVGAGPGWRMVSAACGGSDVASPRAISPMAQSR